MGGHQTHGGQDGFADFDGGELPLHVPSSVERYDTFAVFVLVQTPGNDDGGERGMDFFVADTVEQVLFTVYDKRVFFSSFSWR